MSEKKALSIVVETGPCSFADATVAALAMAKEVEFVSISHNGTAIDVCPDWTPRECELAWSYAAMVSRGARLEWRRVAEDGHPYSAVAVAAAMVSSQSLHDEVMGRIANAKDGAA